MKAVLLTLFILIFSGCAQPVVEQSRAWLGPPMVLVCDTAPTNLKETRDDFEWWFDISNEYNIREFITGPCYEDYEFDTIMIRLEDPGEIKNEGRYTIGFTRLYADNDFILYSAVIVLPRDSSGDRDKDRELRLHEIGHAWGWEHSKLITHIMHPWVKGFRTKQDLGLYYFLSEDNFYDEERDAGSESLFS